MDSRPHRPRIFPAFLLVACIAVPLPAQIAEGTGIVYGPKHAFMLTAPDGWVLDNASGRAQGLQVVFYPRGDNYADSVAFMYASGAALTREDPDRASVMASDLDEFRESSPHLVVTSLPDLATGDGKTALVRHFEGDQYGNSEAVAYIEEKEAVVMIVLSSRTKTKFDEAYPAFEKLVKSYRFLTSDVTIESPGNHH